MTLKVHKNWIFVQPIVEQNSKLILPPVFQRNIENARKGIVRYCGPQSSVEPNEKVIFDKWSGQEIEFLGERLLILVPINIIMVEA